MSNSIGGGGEGAASFSGVGGADEVSHRRRRTGLNMLSGGCGVKFGGGGVYPSSESNVTAWGGDIDRSAIDGSPRVIRGVEVASGRKSRGMAFSSPYIDEVEDISYSSGAGGCTGTSGIMGGEERMTSISLFTDD